MNDLLQYSVGAGYFEERDNKENIPSKKIPSYHENKKISILIEMTKSSRFLLRNKI